MQDVPTAATTRLVTRLSVTRRKYLGKTRFPACIALLSHYCSVIVLRSDWVGFQGWPGPFPAKKTAIVGEIGTIYGKLTRTRHIRAPFGPGQPRLCSFTGSVRASFSTWDMKGFVVSSTRVAPYMRRVRPVSVSGRVT